MNIESKEFWEKVKDEYKPLYYKYEFCYLSETFKEQWYKDRQSIKDIAKSFLKSEKILNVSIGIAWLFHCDYGSTSLEIDIRKQFLEYCIQKYSK